MGWVRRDTGPMADQPKYRPGEQPYDRMNAVRIGAVAGGVAGAIPAAILGGAYAILIAVGAVGGAWLGSVWYRRNEDPGRSDDPNA